MVSSEKDMWITYDENPFNPITQFDDWYGFDMAYGRWLHDGLDVCGLIAREAPTSVDNLSDYENNTIINQAINIVLDKYENIYGFKLAFASSNEETNV